MPMVVIITSDVEDRYRGFLGSVMLELSSGVYAHPRLSAGVRARLWSVVSDWHAHLQRGSVVMTWAETTLNGGLGLLTLGEPAKEIVAHDAMLLVRRRLRAGAARR